MWGEIKAIHLQFVLAVIIQPLGPGSRAEEHLDDVITRRVAAAIAMATVTTLCGPHLAIECGGGVELEHRMFATGCILLYAAAAVDIQ